MGFGADAKAESSGELRSFRIRLERTAAGELVRLLATPDTSLRRPGYILVVTSDNMNRLRVVRDRLPAYESRAAACYVRGDLARVTGTARSCNIFVSALGAELIAKELSDAAARAREWVEFRARIVQRRRSGTRSMLEFVPDIEVAARDFERRLGAAGESLAAESWPAGDFADWEPDRG